MSMAKTFLSSCVSAYPWLTTMSVASDFLSSCVSQCRWPTTSWLLVLLTLALYLRGLHLGLSIAVSLWMKYTLKLYVRLVIAPNRSGRGTLLVLEGLKARARLSLSFLMAILSSG